MPEQNSIEEIFFKFLSQYQFEEENLDYLVVQKNLAVLQTLSNIGN
jgi:hypothetical protein